MDLQTTKDFERPDTNKGALINTNKQALEQYKLRKKQLSKLNRIEELEKKVDKLTDLLEKLLESK